MVKTLQLLKGSRFGSWLISILCASVLALALVSTTPRKAEAQGITEYGAILAFVAVLVGLVFSLGSGGLKEAKHLNAVILSAQRANSKGDSAKEISQLNKAIGDSEALLILAAPCTTCDQLKSTVQQIIGLAASQKANVLGAATGVCNPEAIVCSAPCQCSPNVIP